MIDFKQYIKQLQSVPLSELTEHSRRSALEALLKQASASNQAKKTTVLQEPKRKENYGSPDFKIYTENSIIGYVENKKITENLDKIIESEQIKKYRELSNNLLVTNYIEFVWIKDEIIKREALCYLSDIETKNFQLDNEKEQKVEKLLSNFFSQAPEKIAHPKNLAFALAVRCKNLKDFISDELARQNRENREDGRLFQLYKAFKSNIFAGLSISEFSDAFSQMLVYAFFLAGLNADTKEITIRDAKYHIPASFQLIRELLNFLDELEQPEYKETKWITSEILFIINNIDWFGLKQNLNFSKKITDHENIETDPYIYFYETFLATYDYNLRKAKGVYYTPPHVVNFIVRAIDKVLSTTFALPGGLAERNKVTVLDFATGTGTFLLEAFKIIFDKNPTGLTEKRKMIIKEHLLQNFYGFEYLIAPYTIAHLKLSQYLKENGYEFEHNERLQVFLTNTLEPVDRQIKVPFMPQLTNETKAAQGIKDKPILVITGNPPYSGHSKNTSQWISNEIKEYFTVDGKPLGERNSKWLQDDYVKFIRFAQHKMDKTEQGVVGIITNHSFLDNPTFRGMRQSLMKSFDQLYFIDLHGNSLKKETTPEGKKDENVFDIQQGVCISIFIKKKGLKKGIFHTDLWGKRTAKFDLCLNNSLSTLDFAELKPNSPFYLFVPQDQKIRAAYEKHWSVKDIFEINSVGVVTARDNLTIHFDEKKLIKTINEFVKISEYEARFKFNLGEDARDWKVLLAQNDLKRNFITIKNKLVFDENKIKKIAYRPFDVRYTYYTGNSRGFHCMPRKEVMTHFEKENVGLVTVRQVAEGVFNHAFVTDIICNFRVTISNKGGAYIFPLYRYNGNGNGNAKGTNYLFKEDGKKDNFTNRFRQFIQTKYKAKPVDKKQIAKIQKTIKEQQKQLKQVENLIVSLQKSNSADDLVNLQKQFAEELTTQIEQNQQKLNKAKKSLNANYEPTPEEIFSYIYAILHSPGYRGKYAEFLKMDFPRIPFTENLQTFKNLANLGKELVKKHLLKEIPTGKNYQQLGIYKGKGDNVVIKPVFRTEKNENKPCFKLYINKTQYFETVPQTVYNFTIGGYQVLDKYLKDRKNKALSFDEIETIENTIKVLDFTIKQQKLIDNQTKNWI